MNRINLIKFGRRTFECDTRQYFVQGISNDDPYYSGIEGDFEKKFQLIVKKLVKDNGCVIDVGANIGITSIILSHYLPNSTVYAIEPSKKAFRTLKKNIKINNIKNVKSFNFASADRDTEFRFNENSAYGHINLNNNSQFNSAPIIGKKIDTFVNNFVKDSRINFIKIDVEGFEPQILEGAKKTIEKFKPLVYLEFNTWCLEAFGNNRPIEFLEEIISKYPFVYRVSKNLESSQIVDQLPMNGLALRIFHDNVALHGSVDDLILSFSKIA